MPLAEVEVGRVLLDPVYIMYICYTRINGDIPDQDGATDYVLLSGLNGSYPGSNPQNYSKMYKQRFLFLQCSLIKIAEIFFETTRFNFKYLASSSSGQIQKIANLKHNRHKTLIRSDTDPKR